MQRATDGYRAPKLFDFDVFVDKSIFDGALRSLPLWPTPGQIIFYRKDVLREIGLEAPPLDWPAFTEAAAALTQGDRIGLGLPTSDNSVSAFINMMAGFGPGIFDPATGQIDLSSPEAAETAATLRQLAESGALSRTLLNAMGDDIQDQFAAGRFAMAQAFSGRIQQYREQAAGYDPATLHVSAWPSFAGRAPTVLAGPYWTVGIAETSQNKPAAAAFLEALYSTEASMRWAKVASLIPDRRSVASDPFFQTEDAFTVREFQRLLESEGTLVFPQRLSDVTKVFTVMNTAMQELIGTDEAIDPILQRARASLGW